jgi:hypothetical protein
LATYYEFSDSDSDGERGRTGDTRRTVYTEQFLINLRRSSTKLDDSVISRLRVLGIIRHHRCRVNREGRCIQERRLRSRFLQLTDNSLNSVASSKRVKMGRRSAKPIRNKLPWSECERVLETVNTHCSSHSNSNESNTQRRCFVINARSLKKTNAMQLLETNADVGANTETWFPGNMPRYLTEIFKYLV